MPMPHIRAFSAALSGSRLQYVSLKMLDMFNPAKSIAQ